MSSMIEKLCNFFFSSNTEDNETVVEDNSIVSNENIDINVSIEETKPETQSEIQPETKLEETKPEETKPEETKPEETKLEEIKLEETKPEETKPEETKPEETKPEETKTEETKPEETKPEETKPEETKPEETKPEETKPEETKPEETKPEETKPEEEKTVIFSTEKPKKALLIGINYNNDNNKNDDLNGCENDMNRLSQWINDNCFFNEKDIKKLDSKTATRENMENEIRELVKFANTNKNSEIWFSYSGHGTHYFSSFEKDNQDEIICPSDYNTSGFISDNWLRNEFLNKLPSDCKMFVLMDCCHSGSNMDLPYYLENDKIQKREDTTDKIKANVIKLSGCLDNQVSMDYYNSKMGEFQGAFTNAFVKSYQKENILKQCENLNNFLKLNGFKQISELAISETSLTNWTIC